MRGIVKYSRYGRIIHMSTFGENLKEEREKRGILQKDLANWLDVKPNTIWRWECGEREPHASKVRKMAEIFGVTVSYLMRDSDANEDQLVEVKEEVQPPQRMSAQHKDELPSNVKKIRGKTYVDGVSLDTFARQLRDRLIVELPANDANTLDDVKDALHECLRLFENMELKHKSA